MTGWRSIIATLLMAAAATPALAQAPGEITEKPPEEDTEERVTLDADSVYVLRIRI